MSRHRQAIAGRIPLDWFDEEDDIAEAKLLKAVIADACNVMARPGPQLDLSLKDAKSRMKKYYKLYNATRDWWEWDLEIWCRIVDLDPAYVRLVMAKCKEVHGDGLSTDTAAS